jgi:hypothetical protein
VGKKLDIPDGWNRRFGFAQNGNSESLWTRLHRAVTNPRDVPESNPTPENAPQQGVPQEVVPQEVVPQDAPQQDVPQLK